MASQYEKVTRRMRNVALGNFINLHWGTLSPNTPCKGNDSPLPPFSFMFPLCGTINVDAGSKGITPLAVGFGEAEPPQVNNEINCTIVSIKKTKLLRASGGTVGASMREQGAVLGRGVGEKIEFF
ncbi:hypothetical protein, partial [Desulfovibrio cuneatus]|uniref:hypothetical protein n=1 Tax=Desulfovibrio cuneatus TaxID=159728 RepID=UPI00048509F0